MLQESAHCKVPEQAGCFLRTPFPTQGCVRAALCWVRARSPPRQTGPGGMHSPGENTWSALPALTAPRCWSCLCPVEVFSVYCVLTKPVISSSGVCCYLRLITVMKALSRALLRWHLPLFAADNIKLSDYSRLLSLQSKSTPLKCANKTHGSNKLERSVTAIKEHEGKCTAFATVIIFNLLRSNHFCNMVLLLGVNLISSNTRLQSVFSVNLDVMHISALQSDKPPPWPHDHMVSTILEEMSSTLHIHL